jgi:hypothetical protein
MDFIIAIADNWSNISAAIGALFGVFVSVFGRKSK